jgi:hypothetical protein
MREDNFKDLKMETLAASPVAEPPKVRACGASHELWVGDQPLHLAATRSVLGLFRELSGHGVSVEQFPLRLQDVSAELFGDPKAIDVGTPLKFVRSNGEVQLAASVGSALVQVPTEVPPHA